MCGRRQTGTSSTWRPSPSQHSPSQHSRAQPTLAEPAPRVHASFVEAVREYRAEGRYTRLDPVQLADANQFRRYLDQVRADTRPGVLRHRVPQTNLWLVEGEEYLGRLSIRHRLNRRLRFKGGHIGYDVRPSVRRRGYATLMLRLSLPVAHQLGIDPALITCDDTNVGLPPGDRGQRRPAGQRERWDPSLLGANLLSHPHTSSAPGRTRPHPGPRLARSTGRCVYMDQWVSSLGRARSAGVPICSASAASSSSGCPTGCSAPRGRPCAPPSGRRSATSA